jgi:hypothetical protein
MAGAAMLALVGTGTADASIALGVVVGTNPVNYTPNINQGAVYKMAEVGGILYAGGGFSSVTPAPGVGGGTVTRSNIVAFNAATGVIQSFAPSINGQVWAIVAANGSLYVGGTFTSVNGVSRRGLVKLNPTSGAVDTGFNAGLSSGVVREAAVVNGRLIISGTFPGKVRAVDLASGVNTNYINISITGSVASNAGPTEVYRFAVNPQGTRLVGIGNFTSVGGQTRFRTFMLTLGTSSASVNAWDYVPLRKPCRSTTTPDYLRDVDFSPDGSWFVVVSTGFVPRTGEVGETLCDATARFETNIANPVRPTWINYTGGDTLHSCAATDVAVYVQGHQRWLDNPLGRDSAGPGAVSRPGIGAIHPGTGKALSWNPTKNRGVGGKDLLVTPRGLWVGSDTDRIGKEFHARIALLPVP